MKRKQDVVKATDTILNQSIASLYGYSNVVDKSYYTNVKAIYDSMCQEQGQYAAHVMRDSDGDSASFYRQHVTMDVIEEASPYPMEMFES
jgi:hypothetical protein